MRFMLGQAIIALGAGVVLALIRYYTMYYTLKWIRGRFSLRRRQKEARNG